MDATRVCPLESRPRLRRTRREPWNSEQSGLSQIAQTALEVNLLTEDNLPSYHREIERAFGRDSAWGTWVHRWTAEEGRHAYCIRDYLLVTRGVDPDELERARLQVMQTGYDSGEKPSLQMLVYTSLQERATRISHRNTGRYIQDLIVERMLSRIATDENLHMVFYRDLVKAALEITPGPTLRAITSEVINFKMPGTVIPNFVRKAAQIARAGIYNLRIHHDEVIWPLLRQWGCSTSTTSTPRVRRRAPNSPHSSPSWTRRPDSSRSVSPRRQLGLRHDSDRHTRPVMA
jgi:acyl-[acyl-carrier-protein] desaturase